MDIHAHRSLTLLLVTGSLAFASSGCFSSDAATAGSGATGATTPDNEGGASTGDTDTGAPVVMLKTSMIDDMEDGDGSILNDEGRVGAWYTYNDETVGSMQTPAEGAMFTMTAGGRDGSGFAADTHGTGFTTWGAGMGFNLKDPGNGDGGSMKSTYDASAYTGITFWAKVGSGSGKAIRVNVSNKDTDPAGMVCAPAAKCSDHFGKDLTLTSDWAQYVIPFDKMSQVGWGQSVAKFDTSTVYAVQFQTGKNITFDVWLDEVAFIEP